MAIDSKIIDNIWRVSCEMTRQIENPVWRSFKKQEGNNVYNFYSKIRVENNTLVWDMVEDAVDCYEFQK